MKQPAAFLVKYALYLFCIVVISFGLPRLLPGNPLSVLDEASASQNLTASSTAFREYYAPDKPLAEQFTLYLRHLLQGDLGYSLTAKRPVAGLIGESLWWSVLLAGLSMAAGTALGVWYGVHAGMLPNRRPLRAVPLVILQAVPVILLAATAQLLFCYKLRLFPTRGAYSVGMTPADPGFWWDALYHMLLPLLIMTLVEAPSIAIFAYNSTMRMKKEQFVQMAVYLNIDPQTIRRRFLLKNIIPELLGKLSIQCITCLAGTLFVESVFAYPGIGLLLRNATANRDYTLMQGILLVVCLAGVAVNGVFELLIEKTARVG